MRSFAIGCIVVAILSLSLQTSNNSHSDENRVESIEKRQNEFFASVSARDADKTAEFFSETAVLQIANRPPVEGRDAIHRFYQNMFGFLAGSTAEAHSLRISENRDMAYGFGRTVNVFAGPNGTAEYEGKYVLIWEKIDGEWMITLYGISNNQPESTR